MCLLLYESSLCSWMFWTLCSVSTVITQIVVGTLELSTPLQWNLHVAPRADWRWRW